MLFTAIICAMTLGSSLSQSVETAEATRYSWFNAQYVQDYWLEGEWDLTEIEGQSLYSPWGKATHFVVVTDKAGSASRLPVHQGGLVLASRYSLTVLRDQPEQTSSFSARVEYCPPPRTQTTYSSADMQSVSTSGGCWVFAFTPGFNCPSGRCEDFGTGGCKLTISLASGGSDEYEVDCGEALKFVNCDNIGGNTVVCH